MVASCQHTVKQRARKFTAGYPGGGTSPGRMAGEWRPSGSLLACSGICPSSKYHSGGSSGLVVGRILGTAEVRLQASSGPGQGLRAGWPHLHGRKPASTAGRSGKGVAGR